MMLRHFAFFAVTPERMVDREGRSFDGCRCVREFKGEVVDAPDVNRIADEGERQLALSAWQDAASGRRADEICLDVTQFDYPLGDFEWMVFRPNDQTDSGKRGLLDWPTTHVFAEIDRDTLTLHAYVISPRPVRSDARNIVVDVTGTKWEQRVREGQPMFGRIRKQAVGPATTVRALAAADAQLDPVTPGAVKEAVIVSA